MEDRKKTDFFLPVWPSEVFQSSVERQSPEPKFQILIPKQKNRLVLAVFSFAKYCINSHGIALYWLKMC